jgi:hypothetical protein
MRVVAKSALRVQGGHEREAMRAFPPLAADHPSVGDVCAVCGEELLADAIVTVIPLGPGADPDDQAKATRGGWYSCLGVIGHASCAGIAERNGSAASGGGHV